MTLVMNPGKSRLSKALAAVGNQVQVYRNLHTGTYSIRYRGLVVGHYDIVAIVQPTFRVQPGGRARVLREKRKNVHAFVVGKLVPFWDYPTAEEATRISYNPYKNETFIRVDTGEPVKDALMCWLTPDGVFAQLR